MNKQQEAKRSMLIAVRDYLNTEIAVWTGSVGMTNAVNALTAHIDQIDVYSLGQQQDTKGASGNKLIKRNVLVAKTKMVADGLSALGNATGDWTLAGQATMTKTKLVRLQDTFLGDVALSIFNLGNANAAVVADYNVSGADIAALGAARTAYMQGIERPKNLISARKTNTSGLNSEILAAMRLLENVLDMLVRTYTESAPNFVLVYFNNRVIFDVGSRTIAVRFHVMEAAGGTALGLVNIVVMPGDIKKRTTGKGNCQIQFLKSGTYTASFNRPGYLDKQVTFYVTAGVMTRVEVVMEGVG
ncbi:MAG: hypothetical protein IPL48_14570 [Bacteroidetes bacterium]|nr:hypothetical protein [Bacteroidota bacterium]